MSKHDPLDPIRPDGTLDGAKRAAQKQASRDRDEADLKAGRISQEELMRRNDFFADVDLSNVRIAAIGDKPYTRGR